VGVEVWLYPFFNLGARWMWVVNATPRPLYPIKDPVTIVQDAGLSPGPVWKGTENLAYTSIRIPDRPALSQSLYRLSYPGYILFPVFLASFVFIFFFCGHRRFVALRSFARRPMVLIIFVIYFSPSVIIRPSLLAVSPLE